MQYYSKVWIIAGLIAAMPLAVNAGPSGGKGGGTISGVIPATVEHIEGSDLSTVTLTEKAAERIGLETSTVKNGDMGGKDTTYVPYSSIIYDPHGKTWVYTSPKARTFVRHEIVIDDIKGDRVFVSSGPPKGTVVASVGVAEIYGTEFEVGH